MTNFGFNKFCEDNGIAFIPTKVGDRFVLEEMLLNGYRIGGEQSGHVIFTEFATTGDGQLTALQVLDIIKRAGSPIDQLKKVMTRYPQKMVNVTVTNAGKERLYIDSEVKAATDAATKELSDSGRIVVRASGTEPLIRVMVESNDMSVADRLTKHVADVILKRLGGI